MTIEKLLAALSAHSHEDKVIYAITAEDIGIILENRPDLVALLEGQDADEVANLIIDAIEESGIMEMIETAIVCAFPVSEAKREK